MTAVPAGAHDHLEIYQTSSWHPLFRPFCFKTAFINLPDDILRFLDADGISSRDVPLAVPRAASDSDSEEADEEQSGTSVKSDQGQEFDRFKNHVNDIIQSLGGKVLPKLNWSAPVDAQWISPTGLSCQNADEVLLLLKSSDRAVHDLDCVRKLQQGMCDHCPSHEVQGDVHDHENPDVYDVYVTPKKRVWLLDFNPPGGTTQPLLFTWPELHEAAERMQRSPEGNGGACELRIVTGHMHVQAGAQNVFGVPADTLQLPGMTWGGVMQHLASEVSKQNLQDG